MDYKNGKIYTIRSHQTDKIYIGSTTQPLSKRLSSHKGQYKSYLNDKKKYITSLEIIEYGDAYIELLEDFPCETKDQLHKREGECIRNEPNCVNKCVAGRTQKEYYADNADKIKEYIKQYYEQNTDKVKEQQKQYYINNADKKKEYRQQNAEKRKEYMKTYNADNAEKQKEQKKQYYINNADKFKEYREQHAEKIKEKNKQYKQQNADKLKEQRKKYRENKKKIEQQDI